MNVRKVLQVERSFLRPELSGSEIYIVVRSC